MKETGTDGTAAGGRLSTWRGPRARAALILAGALAAVALGAALRYPGVSWGLRHPPHSDERVFVENIVAMLDAGDFDHRYYLYPGLFFYFLAAGIAWLGPERWHGPDAYLVARIMVATLGVLTVPLAFVVGRRLIGPAGGLLAAFLVAVCPINVVTSHEVRPDVALQFLGLLAALALTQVGARLRGDILMGLVIGVATSVKYTGLLLVPSYLLARWLAPGPRVKGLFVAGVVAVAVGALGTPYSLLHFASFWSGPADHLNQYYPGSLNLATLFHHVAYFLGAVHHSLGSLAVATLLIGLVPLVRSDWRRWTPQLCYPLVTLIVMSTGSLVFERYMLPAMGILAIAAAWPVALLLLRRPTLGVLLALAMVALPLWASVGFTTTVVKPSATDRALDWINTHVPDGARLLDAREDATPGGRGGSLIGVDPARHELVAASLRRDGRALHLLARNFDYVIVGRQGGGRWAKDFDTVFTARRASGWVEFHIKRPRPQDRPRFGAVSLAGAELRVSSGADAREALRDGRPDTSWRADPSAGPEWIELRWPAPVRIGRVELVLGAHGRGSDARLTLRGSVDGREWESLVSVGARAPTAEQRRRPSYLLLVRPREIRGLRIERRDGSGAPLDVVELRIAAARNGGSFEEGLPDVADSAE